MAEYRIEAVESAPFAELSYVVWREGQRDALVVDPGFDTQSILALIEREKLSVAAILNTHGHVDHIAGNGAIKSAFPLAPLIIGENEQFMLADPIKNLSDAFGTPVSSPAADRLVKDQERIEVAAFRFLVREIPGHSPGSVVFIAEDFEPKFVLGGDVLFAGSVGRTDLGGNAEQLLTGIREKLLILPDDTVVYPGHGPATTVGLEKRRNPYVGERANELSAY
jgi:glyoxylase-like metal-dependent hydrolase (beta-lactamase superfamily II)